MKKYLYLFLGVLSSLLLTCNVNALANINDFSNLTIADKGQFYNNTSDTAFSSVGYRIDELSFPTNSTGQPATYAQPTSTLQTVFNGYGASISQCGFSFKSNNYYSMTFYFLSDAALNIQYSPAYTRKSNKLGISNGLSGTTTFNPESFESGVNSYVNKPYYVSWYSIVFKAPQDGTCVTSAFSTNPTYTHYVDYSILGYLGYTYTYVGEGSLSAGEIQNALQGQFNSINSNINSGVNSVNSNIDSMKDKQDETNKKLDEQNETSKGILGTIKDLFTSIPKWFSGLADSIGNFFANLANSIGEFFENMMNGIKELFYGKEEKTCSTHTNLFVGFDKTESRIGAISSISLRPNENGYISTFYNSFLTYLSNPISSLKPNTEYTFILELEKDVSNAFSINNYNGSIQFKYSGSSNTNWTKGNTPYYYYLTTNSDVDTQSYSFALPGNGATVGVRYMILEGHIDENTFEYEYFTGSKEFCSVTGSSGGLFGILNNFFTSIGNWFKELLTGILDGIKALFVPTDEQLYEIIDDSSKLTENFGFVGESVSFFITIFTSLLGLVNANGCVELPEFSIGQTTLFDSHVFWERQQVCLNDNIILSSNINTIRTITSIVLVCMFINFAASKFFTILSKNDTGTDVNLERKAV